jgi:hypothetical protein
MQARTSKSRPRFGSLPVACAAALALALTLGLARGAQARRIAPPPVPPDLQVDAGSRPFLVGHAVGTQNYVCLPLGGGFAWTLFTPEATLFDDRGRQLTTHFFSPNPQEPGSFRPAWQHSRDTSSVWAKLGAQSSDPAFVAPGALPWFLLEVVGELAGPRGGEALTAATQIHRVKTAGGVAPATGCAALGDVGKKEIVPYTADYYFYTKPKDREDAD